MTYGMPCAILLDSLDQRCFQAGADMPHDKLTFTFSLSIFFLAACSGAGETAGEAEVVQTENNASASEDGIDLRQINGSEQSEVNGSTSPAMASQAGIRAAPQDEVPRPEDARAFCAGSRDTMAEVEQDADTLPSDVRQSGAGAWRCLDRKAMVCDLGATGMACLSTGPMDRERLEAFTRFCRQFPDSNHIPHSLTVGLASVWRCDYTTPVQRSTTPVDSMGYYKHSWRVLN